MDTLTTILQRRSIRQYRPQPIPDEDLERILEACRRAPSAGNRQPWHFVIVGDPEQKARLAEACRGQTWMADAAYIVVAVGLPEVSANWYRVDVAIAMENLVLAAHGLGYGTCWIGALASEEIRTLCGLPEGTEVLACTPLGVPGEVSGEMRPRKEWDEVFSRERYGQRLSL